MDVSDDLRGEYGVWDGIWIWTGWMESLLDE